MSRTSHCRFTLPALFLFTALSLNAQVNGEAVVLAGGAVAAANATTHLNGTFGQPIISTAAIPEQQVFQGFWHAGIRKTLASFDEPVAGVVTPKLYCAPNPIAASATVRVDLPRTEATSLALHDLLGREVCRILPVEERSGTLTLDLDTRELPEGPYTLVLTSGTNRQTLPVNIVR